MTTAPGAVAVDSQCRSSQVVCDVSVIVVSYNTRDVTLQCLRSIYAHTRRSTFEVLVIDNASSDGSAAAIAREYPQATLIANSGNRGFAGGNNQGLKIARGRYALLLNPDTIVLDGAIDRSIAFADQHPELAVVGCQVLEDQHTIQRTCFAFQTPLNLFLGFSGLSRLFPRSRWFARPQMSWWGRDSLQEVDVVSGMFMLVRSAAIAQVGLMDEDYFVYGEEADWCYRFWRAGWRCCFAPVAQIIHLDGGNKSTDQRSLAMYVQNQKSVLLFNRKHYGRLAWAAARGIYIAAMLTRSVIWGLQAWRGDAAAGPRARQAAAALRYHILGREPRE
jgi:GT2 family glycosyltransferase